jgi:hypothetical protein
MVYALNNYTTAVRVIICHACLGDDGPSKARGGWCK